MENKSLIEMCERCQKMKCELNKPCHYIFTKTHCEEYEDLDYIIQNYEKIKHIGR